MARLGSAEVRRIARLARLDLPDEEVERLATELAAVLDDFEAIAAAGTGAVDEVRERGPAPRLREDTPPSDRLAEKPERSAPEWRDGFFVVPRLAALGGSGKGKGSASDAEQLAEASEAEERSP